MHLFWPSFFLLLSIKIQIDISPEEIKIDNYSNNMCKLSMNKAYKHPLKSTSCEGITHTTPQKQDMYRCVGKLNCVCRKGFNSLTFRMQRLYS